MTLEDVIAVCEDYGYRRTGPNSDLLLWLRGMLKDGESAIVEVSDLTEVLSGQQARADSYREDYEYANERADAATRRVFALEQRLAALGYEQD